MKKEENPLNAPTSDSIKKGELSFSELSDSGATFIFSSDNPEVDIDVGWIGYDSEIKSEQKVGKQNELLLTVPKAIVETWLGMKLYAQCKATLGEKQYTSPKTLFTVVP
ncbi:MULTISPECIES: hypothetical protein [unclassified Pseudomonas]|uniref:hypothetical protein n=1 Tax=unclassified Pseudomonas TaxID=196821 RepID=UPI002A363E0F|nr:MULTISPECIES: hypothetical protein [unclassified Pseudomonas]MDX9672805.1 hypothetical protein [Pseudomonas sp. P8_250]WPN38640.1 hypothetical protein QMK53_13595 [Pseudomonas sp. P8_139]WPN39557.1 hypothetical protein QMK55_17780 [Pseudomonas sp. P8_229]